MGCGIDVSDRSIDGYHSEALISTTHSAVNSAACVVDMLLMWLSVI